MVGPGDESTAMDIRDQAHRIWRAVPRYNKVEWDHLFDLRHSDLDIFKKGHDLLRTQGMLARLKPDHLKPDHQVVTDASTSKHEDI